MASRHLQLRLDQSEPVRVDRLVTELTSLSRSQVLGLFDHDCVAIDQTPCTDCLAMVAPGSVVSVDYDPHRRYRPRPRAWTDSAYKLVYEDKDLLVVDKSAWILTVPTEGGHGVNLMERLGRYLARGGKPQEAHPAHRLDRGVSGLLVVGKSAEISRIMRDQFEAHKPKRLYHAIVQGTPQPDSGIIRSYLATAANLTRYSTAYKETGQLAITHYQTLHSHPEASWLQVELETGRRNQIRVHFAEQGHPVLGDLRYRGSTPEHPLWTAKRMALHAAELTFEHPVTGKPMAFNSPIPGPMQQFWSRLLAGAKPKKTARTRPDTTPPANRGKPQSRRRGTKRAGRSQEPRPRR